MNFKISIVGSGNVATFMATKLFQAGHDIVQIYSRDLSHAAELSAKVNANPIDNLDVFSHKIDYLLFAVKDDALLECIQQLKENNQFCWLHTSGAASMEIFKNKTENFGVLYPLQTFSKVKELTFSTFPILLENSASANQTQLEILANAISPQVLFVNSEKRKTIHLAAVFACNFPNYLFQVATNLLEQEDLKFDLMLPLIKETVNKLETLSAKDAQTGPAIRNDQKTMEHHLELLAANPTLSRLYELLSAEIQGKGNQIS